MPNLFICFSSGNRLQTPTNPISATEGVRKRLAALSAEEVQPLLNRSILAVLKNAANHIEGNRHAARHVMDCLQGKRAPDHADTWLQGMDLDRQHTRICATVFHSNLYGRTEPAKKSLAKIACVIERLAARWRAKRRRHPADHPALAPCRTTPRRVARRNRRSTPRARATWWARR